MVTIHQAILARLRESGIPVWDTWVPDDAKPDYPYLLVWGAEMNRIETNPTMGGALTGVSYRVGVMAVGESPESVRIVGGKATRLLEGWEPGLVGGDHWLETELRPRSATPITRDKDMPLTKNGNPVFWGANFYQLTGSH